LQSCFAREKKEYLCSNYEFEMKKQIYFYKNGKSPFVITQELEKYDDWNMDTLRERRERLVNKLVSIYFGD